jgi:DNA-binding transcriptional regulator YhcF (GntR family)
MMHLDKQHPRPIYLQLKEVLRNQIEQGIYLSHQQLPSERDLCQHYNLSRMTARRALQELIAEGFAYTRAGKGTFVSGKAKLAGHRLKHSWDWQQLSDTARASTKTGHGQELTYPLESLDCVGSENAIREAMATQSLEVVACELFPETIRKFERRWVKGEISLLVHNYAITTLHSCLVAMVNAAAMPDRGPKVLLGCAPGDQHDIGLLLLALMLRRRGFRVIYLGSNMASEAFHQVVASASPQLVCITAATEESALEVVGLGQICGEGVLTNPGAVSKSGPCTPVFSFGGSAFSRNPTLVSTVPGLYLGDTIEEAVSKVQELVRK